LESLLNELGGPASQAPSQRSTLSGNRPVAAAGRGGAGGDEDLDLMLKGLSNQMMNIDDATPAARGVCNYCRKPILGEVIQAMNKAFHPEHFICNNCQEPLGTRNFYEQEGHPHCENCYQSLFCARCAHCNKPVLDRCITAMGKKWHLDHFICGKCNAPFPDGMFFEKEGRPWCKNCYSTNFSYRCAACDQGIMGDVVNALGRHWHPEHFVCAFCQMPFEGGTFFAKEGRPYCRQHYNMQTGSACGGCGMAITGRVVEGMGRKWHPEHFVCAFCNTPLTGGGYQQHEGRPYCRNCSSRMF
jgi:paxillin